MEVIDIECLFSSVWSWLDNAKKSTLKRTSYDEETWRERLSTHLDSLIDLITKNKMCFKNIFLLFPECGYIFIHVVDVQHDIMNVHIFPLREGVVIVWIDMNQNIKSLLRKLPSIHFLFRSWQWELGRYKEYYLTLKSSDKVYYIIHAYFLVI